MRFSNKVAFITGGGAGIGEVYAQALAKEGAAVVLADIDMVVAEAAADRIRSTGGEALAIRCDVGDEVSIKTAVDGAIAKYGGIDILVNNAAKHLSEFSVPPTKLPLDKWRTMLNVNVVGIVACSAACRETMRARGGGVIINQASISGLTATNSYGVSKLAVRGITVALAHELAADKTRVYCIAPGIVDSPSAMATVPQASIDANINKRQLVKRQGKMSDLVGALLFFCSEEASFITGEMLVIGGGYPTRI